MGLNGECVRMLGMKALVEMQEQGYQSEGPWWHLG